MNIDLLIPAAPKDYIKLPHIIASVAEFVPIVKRVCLVTPDFLFEANTSGLQVDCYTDEEVLPYGYNRSVIGWRPNWITQQIIKLTQEVTDTEYWLTIDADTFFNRKVPFFTDEGKPILYTGMSQYHPPYYGFNKVFLGVDKLHSQSFLSECTLYKREFVDELIQKHGDGDRLEFAKKIIEIINTGNGLPADSEIYGTFVLKNHPDHYLVKPLVMSLGGRYGNGEWTEAEIIKMRKDKANEACDTFSMHSWSDFWK